MFFSHSSGLPLFGFGITIGDTLLLMKWPKFFDHVE